MRLLHTSDWHLGQTLHGFDRSDEHQAFLDWLLDTLVAERIDALLIAGDIYDNANPSAASQKQLYRFLRRARAAAPHLNIVIIAGNHDSPGRLEAPGPLLEEHAVTLIGQVGRDASGDIDVDSLVRPLLRRDGSIAAWCLAVPFLRPGDVPRVEDSENPYAAGVAELYRRALDRALARRAPGQAIVALGHCHMVGAAPSADSERRIVIGGSEALPSTLFGPEIAYAALGHLHLAQTVGKEGQVRYSGSPLPMSFSETHYPHQVLRIDLDGETALNVAPLLIPRTVDMLRIPPRHAPLPEALALLAELPEACEAPAPYLEVRIALEQPEPGLRARIEAALTGRHARLARIDTVLPRRRETESAAMPEQLAQLQPDDIFQRLYRQKYDADAPPDQMAAFAELMLAATGAAR